LAAVNSPVSFDTSSNYFFERKKGTEKRMGGRKNNEGKEARESAKEKRKSE
jgi:hypothetical protein